MSLIPVNESDNLQIFNNAIFGNVRVILQDNEPWFVAKDVCDCLEIKNTTDALKRLDDDERARFNLGRQGETNIVNEYGLYSLVLSSRKPEAKEFKRWITHDVLPALRRTGSYSLNIPQTLPEALRAYADEVEQHNKTKALVEAQRPKVIFADAVSTSDTDILIGDLAKLLNQNGHNIGQNRLFERLRKEGYLISRKGNSYNTPTQKAMELGLFRIKETAITHADGRTTINKTPKVTGKGQLYFINRYEGIQL